MKNWHVWTVDQNRFKRIKEFIESVDEIDDYLYPMASKEYDVKGKRKTKEVPLYSNYIFLLYSHTPELLNKISECPWIKNYLGKCSSEEVKAVKNLSKKKYAELLPTEEICVGHSYKLQGTPFKGFVCTVVEIIGNKAIVSVELFGSDKLIKCLIDDIDLEG